MRLSMGSLGGYSDVVNMSNMNENEQVQTLQYCRGTIEKLRDEKENERNKRRELQIQTVELDAAYQRAANDLEMERNKLHEQELLTKKTKMELQTSEQRMERLEAVKIENFRQLTLFKNDIAHRDKEKDEQIRDLTNSLSSVEKRIAVMGKQELSLNVKISELNEEKEELQREKEKKIETADVEHQCKVQRMEDQARRAALALEEQMSEVRSSATQQRDEMSSQFQAREKKLREELSQRTAIMEQCEMNIKADKALMRTQAAERDTIFRDQLRCETNSYELQLCEQAKEISSQQDEIRRLREQNDRITQDMEAQRISQKTAFEKYDEERRILQDKWLNLSSKNSELEKKMDKAKQDTADAHDRELKEKLREMTKLQETITELKAKLEIKHHELEEIRVVVKTEEEKRKMIERRMDAEKDAHSTTQKKLEDAFKKLNECQGRLTDAVEEKTEHASKISDCETIITKLQKDQGDLEAQRQKDLRHVEEERNKMKKENESLKDRIKQMNVSNELRFYELRNKVQLEEEKNNMLMKRADTQHENAIRAQEELRKDSTEAVTKLRKKYESKLSKLQRQLMEREAYEQELKTLLEHEVGNVSRWHKELDRIQELQSTAGEFGKNSREKLKLLEKGHSVQKALSHHESATIADKRKEAIMARIGWNGDDDGGLDHFAKHKKDAKIRSLSADRCGRGQGIDEWTRNKHRLTVPPGGTAVDKEFMLMDLHDAECRITPDWMKVVERRIEKNVLKSLGR